MPACKILFFLLLALCTSCGECDEFVKYGQVGGEVSMDCGVPQNSDVEWKLNDILIIKINGKRGTRQKGHSHIKDKVSANGGTLKVPRLETRDSGVYSCNSGKRYTLHAVSVSVFAKPGPVLVQSSDVELHCDITGHPNVEVQWLSPSNDKKDDKKQVIHLKSVSSKDDGQWTCLIKDDLKFSLKLTIVGLQTTAVEVPEGGKIVLPCSLPQSVSQRVVGGKWTADHLPTVSFPTLKNTETKGLHWSGDNSSKVIFTSDQLSINYDVTLINAQRSDEGKYVCTVEFEGELKLTAETSLTVVAKPSGGQEVIKVKGKTSAGGGTWRKEVFGLQLWIWIAVGASSLVLIGLIIVAVLVRQRNKRMKKRVKKLRSMRQPLTAKDYCRCRAESEVELVGQERPLPVPRQQRNPRTRTAGPNHTIEKRREQDY
ncbi:T-cell surface glycoprotein CD4-like isoform X2 [Megalobrama amblycephala]|uniref:T-cell surface glycoprotein CD4-like isoform X2 n=1 Tax=Megalobrama amblycephala TaxID=75352 RepID=UPI002013C97D|nr:T-cell surface glycoprotein CD4-like isoform X2 [Megalobrama amblycephala]